jgi:hypothetical protein
LQAYILSQQYEREARPEARKQKTLKATGTITKFEASSDAATYGHTRFY